MNQATITLTDNARRHVEKVLARETDGIGLRLAVKTTGCSGYQYVIETARRLDAGDRKIESNGVTIVVDDKSLRYLAGSELDFVREGLNAGFKFSNPNVEESCGCGESFSLKQGST